MSKKICGILGGMGPEATVDLMARIVRFTDANEDGDHVHCIVDQNPQVPSRIKAILEGGPSPGPVLAKMAKNLQEAGADFVCMPCNTAHHWLLEATGDIKIPFLDMPSLATAQIAGKGSKKCGILGTTATREKKVYDPHCAKYGLEICYPDDEDQAELLKIINEVKGGNYSGREAFAKIASNMIEKGADSLIIACTELGILGLPDDLAANVVDAPDALAKEIIIQAGAKLKPDLACEA